MGIATAKLSYNEFEIIVPTHKKNTHLLSRQNLKKKGCVYNEFKRTDGNYVILK